MSKIAIIETGGKQYRVKERDILDIEKLPQKIGDTVIFDKVLLVGYVDGLDVQIGKPYLENVSVEGTVLDQKRLKKIVVVKYKPKTRYKRTIGHRQNMTRVQITKLP